MKMDVLVNKLVGDCKETMNYCIIVKIIVMYYATAK